MAPPVGGVLHLELLSRPSCVELSRVEDFCAVSLHILYYALLLFIPFGVRSFSGVATSGSLLCSQFGGVVPPNSCTYSYTQPNYIKVSFVT